MFFYVFISKRYKTRASGRDRAYSATNFHVAPVVYEEVTNQSKSIGEDFL